MKIIKKYCRRNFYWQYGCLYWERNNYKF